MNDLAQFAVRQSLVDVVRVFETLRRECQQGWDAIQGSLCLADIEVTLNMGEFVHYDLTRHEPLHSPLVMDQVCMVVRPEYRRISSGTILLPARIEAVQQ
jgi:hypothetical protein